MTIRRTPKNLARDLVRQAWPKKSDRERKPSSGRGTGPSTAVRDLVKARSGGYCERCAHSVSSNAEIHHRIPRGMGGSRDPRINLPSNLLVLCQSCHRDIESHRRTAYQQGWLVHRTEDPLERSIAMSYGRVFLDDGGGIRSDPREVRDGS